MGPLGAQLVASVWWAERFAKGGVIHLSVAELLSKLLERLDELVVQAQFIVRDDAFVNCLFLPHALRSWHLHVVAVALALTVAGWDCGGVMSKRPALQLACALVLRAS